MDLVSSSHLKPTHTWPPPDIVQSIGSKLRLLNNTEEPLLVRKNDLTVLESPTELSSTQAAEPSPKFTVPPSSPIESVHVDPDGSLSSSEKATFVSLLREFQVVFDFRVPGYNGATGPIGIWDLLSLLSEKGVSLSTPVTNSTTFNPNLTKSSHKVYSVDQKI